MNRKWQWPKIEIHPLFWLIGALSIVTAQFESIFMIFVLVFFHECAHIAVMMKYNWEIKKIVLLPFGGVAETDEFATRPSHEDWYVVLAGPLFHIGVEFIFMVAIYIFHMPSDSWFLLREINQMILLVNLLPIYPLDGGRLLTLFFEKYFPYYSVLITTILLSIGVCIVCIFFFFLFQATSIGNIFVFFYLLIYLYLVWRKRMYVFLRFLYMRIDQKGIADFPVKIVSAQLEEKILQVCKKLFRPFHNRVYLYEEDGITEISEQTLLKTYLYKSFEPKTMRKARKYF